MVVAESFYTVYLISFVLLMNHTNVCVVCVFIFNLKSDQITVDTCGWKGCCTIYLPSCVECWSSGDISEHMSTEMEKLNILHSTGRKENEKTRKRKREGSEDEGQSQITA